MADTLRLRWASPRYRGAIYAGTMADPANIKIDYLVALENPKSDYTFTVTITQTGGTNQVTSGIALGGLDDTITVDTSGISFIETRDSPYDYGSDDPYNVQVELIRNAAATDTLSLPLHKFPPAPTKEVRYDDHGRFVVDGVLTAWFGGYVYDGASYGPETYTNFKNNYKLDTIFGETTSPTDPLTWKIPKVSSVYYKLSEDGNPEDLRSNFFGDMRADDDLLCWVGCDEPRLRVHKPDTDLTKRDPAKVKAIYDIATQEDPYHPCVNVDTLGVSISRYNINNAVYHDFTACQDALWTDSYPIRNRDNLDQNGKVCLFQVYANRLTWLGQLNTPSFVDYQTGQEDNMLWEDQNLIQGSVPQIQDRLDYNNPFKPELTNIVYQGILTGATQLCPFAWQFDGDPQHDVAWRDLGDLIEDIRAENNWIMLGEQLNEKIQFSYTGMPVEEKHVQWCRRVSPTHEYIIVINMTYEWNYLSQLRDTPVNVTLTFEEEGSNTVTTILGDPNLNSSYTLSNNSMSFTLDGVNVGNNRAGVAVFKRSITPTESAVPPVISPVSDRESQAASLPRDYNITGFCSTNDATSGPLHSYTVISPAGFSFADSDVGIMTAEAGAPEADNTVTFSVTNDGGTTQAAFQWNITAAAVGITLSDPDAIDITPTTAAIVCKSNSLEGTIYAGVALSPYTEKQVLKDPNDPKHVWHGSKQAAIDVSFPVTGTEPEVQYYVGFYQEDLITPTNELVDFRTDTGLFTFSRNSTQTGGTAEDTLVNQPIDVSVHVGASWDGDEYTDTGSSKGVLLEPAVDRLTEYQYSINSMDPKRVTGEGTLNVGALTLGKMEETADTAIDHYVRQWPAMTQNTVYCLSAICKSAERNGIDIRHWDFDSNYIHNTFILDGLVEVGIDPGIIKFRSRQLTSELVRVWYVFNSGAGPANPNPYVGVGITDPADPSETFYDGVPGNGLYTTMTLEEGAAPTSPINGEGLPARREATSLTSTLTTLGFTKALNDISFQLPVHVNFDYDDNVGAQDILTLGTGSNTLVVAIDGGSVTLTKTHGGTAATPATVSGLTYAYGDRLNIRGYVSSTGGVKLWVGGVSDTVSDNNPFSIEPDDVEVHPARIIAEQLRYKNDADDTEVGNWT